MPSVGILLTLTMTMSDALLIPVDLGIPESMTGVDSILDLMTKVREQQNSDLTEARIVANRLDRQVSV
ncbi:MAG: ParA family protein [Planctomycetes bacterium]|nr:ParA family protein [Planctomycetota bacterium]